MNAIARKPGRVLSSTLAAGAILVSVVFAAVPSGATTSDGDVVLGSSAFFNCAPGATPNCENSSTGIFDTASGDNALVSQATGTGFGVIGKSGSGDGVFGSSSAGYGVEGYSTFNAAVFGSSPNQYGVEGSSSAGVGVYGTSGGRDAVFGYLPSSSTGTNAVRGTADNHGYGVYGTTDGEGSAGVWGDNLSGPGVKGTSGYIGVIGRVTGSGGYGVWGVTLNDGSTAVYADAGGTNGTALAVNGLAAFSRSGMLSMPAGVKVATVSGVSLSTSSLVLAMVQNNSGVFVKYALPIIPSSAFRIYLNKAVPSGMSATVAWFVVN